MSALDADAVVRLLELVPLPEEGGMYRQVHGDAHSTAIFYLLAAPEFSGMHRLPGVEVFHHYAGAPVQMLLLHADGAVEEPVLGADLAAGERPMVVVPGGTWQGCETLSDWSLLGATMAPGYRDEDFALGGREELMRQWPQAAGRLARLTRS